jgi:hypothetical protein
MQSKESSLSLSWNFKQGIQRHQGWLVKTGEHVYSSSRKRFFVLDVKQHLLKYFTDETRSELLGCIDMKAALCVTKSSTKEFTFEIKQKNNSRIFELATDSEDSLEIWITTLSNIILAFSTVDHMEATFPSGYCLFQKVVDVTGFLLEYCSCTNGDFILALDHGVNVLKRNLIGTPTQDDIIGIIWILYYKVACYDELFTSGLLRIDDMDDKLYDYFSSYPDKYQRFSSHFNERKETDEFGQFGIDINATGLKGNFKLPCQKHAILFFKLRDGSLCIKLENAGCPPIYTSKHMNKEDISSYVNHALDFVHTRNAGSNKLYRKEHVPEGYKEIFLTIISNLSPDDYEDTYLFGCTYGISMMIHAIQAIIDGPLEENNLGDSMALFKSAIVLPKQKAYSADTLGPNLKDYNVLCSLILKDIERGYQGERKGFEVCLPSIGKWSEVQNLIKL